MENDITHTVTVHVTYHNDIQLPFQWDGSKPKGSNKTICRDIPFSERDSMVKEVHIQQKTSVGSTGQWRTNGILVQENAQGKVWYG